MGVVGDTALTSSAGLFQATGAGKARHGGLLGQSMRVSALDASSIAVAGT